MTDILIRKAVTPDIDSIAKLEHELKTSHVWQMQKAEVDGAFTARFIETALPRAMRIPYPHSPESLHERWNDFSLVLVACRDGAPVGYIAVDAFFAPGMVWIKDLVVDEIWRRQGVAGKLINAVVRWGKERGFLRFSLEMSSKNYPAICLAQNSKFEFSGFNENFYKNQDIALFFTRTERR